MGLPHFRIPLNLPHAGTIACRIDYWMRSGTTDEAALETVDELLALLTPIRDMGENPPAAEAKLIVAEAAALGRAIVDAIERVKIGHDRLGQAVRNLFECLELGEEGAQISLRAGENPNSVLRPI